MTNAELIVEIARQTTIHQDDVKLMLTAFTDITGDALSNGGEVVISKLGTFGSIARPSREGRNPRTGDKIQIAARVNPTFHPARALRDQTNGGPKTVVPQRRRRA